MPAPRLVLASASPYRARLLARLGVPFEQMPADVDERAHDELLVTEGAEALALYLAELKACVVAVDAPDAVVLAADQVGVVDVDGVPRQLTKPAGPERAVEQLMAMSGGVHRLVNGLVVVDPAGGLQRAVEVAVVHMRSFERAEAVEYVERFEPFDTAGGYRIEDDFDLVESIEGPPDSVEGLPLDLCRRMLEAAGVLEAAGSERLT